MTALSASTSPSPLQLSIPHLLPSLLTRPRLFFVSNHGDSRGRSDYPEGSGAIVRDLDRPLRSWTNHLPIAIGFSFRFQLLWYAEPDIIAGYMPRTRLMIVDSDRNPSPLCDSPDELDTEIASHSRRVSRAPCPSPWCEPSEQCLLSARPRILRDPQELHDYGIP
jgi:hypothetical protein